ncbi:hypothetical protein Pelo_16990 [Pelomyxa schiedti]|nr:hypothetical protein Pelo_16990 [Pelomyxa schiedti]
MSHSAQKSPSASSRLLDDNGGGGGVGVGADQEAISYTNASSASASRRLVVPHSISAAPSPAPSPSPTLSDTSPFSGASAGDSRTRRSRSISSVFDSKNNRDGVTFAFPPSSSSSSSSASTSRRPSSSSSIAMDNPAADKSKAMRTGVYHATVWWVCVTLVICACSAASDLWLWRLTPVVSGTDPHAGFSEQRAFGRLTEIASAGPRCVGTEALITVYGYLQDQITGMIATKQNQNVAVEMNFTSSFYGVGQKGVMYEELPLLYVRLFSPDSEGSTLLLCTHVDAVCTGQGVSDNAYAVSELLEVIYVLTSSENLILKSPIIFLFGIGEIGFPENGSLLYLPWDMSSVNAFITFSSLGTAVQMALFSHAGKMPLAEAYKGAPHSLSVPFFDDLFRHGFFLRKNNHSIIIRQS